MQVSCIACRTHLVLVNLAIALVFYDATLTIDREMKYVWPKVSSGSSLLFLCARYSCFLLSCATIMEAVPMSSKTHTVRYLFSMKL